MKNLRFICAQPRLLYYAWQVEVMINNFIKNGIAPENIDILIGWNPDDETSSPQNIEAWEKVSSSYSGIRFFFYRDTREQPVKYISSIRPNILKQHFRDHQYLSSEAIFYHDCDIVFTKPPDFTKFCYDNIWYLSDTNSYINSTYILSKGHDVYNKMCDIVGIDRVIPKLMNSNSGGAQYILKNVDEHYWEKVEKDSDRLFEEITQLNISKQQSDPSYHELQIWCADMWAVLWNGWKRGNETKVVPELSFGWATDPAHMWDNNTIYHNAGVTCACGRTFFKPDYRDRTPYGLEDNFNQETAVYKYYLEIKETETKSCLL